MARNEVFVSGVEVDVLSAAEVPCGDVLEEVLEDVLSLSLLEVL